MKIAVGFGYYIITYNKMFVNGFHFQRTENPEHCRNFFLFIHTLYTSPRTSPCFVIH